MLYDVPACPLKLYDDGFSSLTQFGKPPFLAHWSNF